MYVRAGALLTFLTRSRLSVVLLEVEIEAREAGGFNASTLTLTRALITRRYGCHMQCL